MGRFYTRNRLVINDFGDFLALPTAGGRLFYFAKDDCRMMKRLKSGRRFYEKKRTPCDSGIVGDVNSMR